MTADHHSPGPLTRQAVQATLHCLTGCAIGEVLGLVLATWWGWSNGPSVALAIVLAFGFGYSLTLVPLVLVVPGAMAAGLTDALFWTSLAVSLAVAFVVTVPVNRWLIARGRGHAVV